MKIHVCMATNKMWLRFAERAIYDMAIRKNPETELKFYVLLDAVEDTSELMKLDAIDGIEIVTESIDLREQFGDLKNYPYHYIGPFKHMKFLIPELPIFEGVERVLYIDTDVLVRKDLTELYTVDLEGKALGVCRDYYNLLNDRYTKELDECETKIESGFALMDLPKLREVGFVEQCKQASINASGDVRVINEVYYPLAKLLDIKYELPFHEMTDNPLLRDIQHWNTFGKCSYSSLQELIDASVIWHFSGNKENFFMYIPFMKKVFMLSEKRLVDFLRTGEVMQWKFADDAELYTFY